MRFLIESFLAIVAVIGVLSMIVHHTIHMEQSEEIVRLNKKIWEMKQFEARRVPRL
jgi:hypothetical protein